MRNPDEWEKAGMTWWNSLQREDRERMLLEVEKVLGRPGSVADAWRLIGFTAAGVIDQFGHTSP
jgi:hypothetical protein